MEKIRVMLVDDDRLAVEYMRNLMDWETLGYEIVAVAYNGKQALKLIGSCSPHLVITDISMPQMNGIELSRKIKEFFPETRIILLTAYGEFGYAKEAVSLGVDDYIMKDEVTPAYLEQKLKTVRVLLNNHQKVSQILFQKIILDYFQLGDKYVRGFYQDHAAIDFFEKPHHYLLVERNLPLLQNEENRYQERRTPTEILEQCLKTAAIFSKVELYSALTEHIFLFVLEEDNIREYEKFQRNHRLGDNICIELNSSESERFTVYVTEHAMYFKELFWCIQEKDSVLQASLFEGTGKVWTFRRHCLDKMERLPKIRKEEIGRRFLDGTFSQEMGVLFRACFLKAGGGKIFLDYAKSAYDFFLQEEKKYLLFSDEEKRKNNQVFDYPELLTLLRVHEEYLRTKRDSENRSDFRLETKRAMDYISEHYGNPSVKISDIAEYLKISESRISVIFKEDTGMTLVQYLTGIRIEQAKRLLTTTNMKIYEIAEIVGYRNAQYLSTVFAKEIGCFPMEYRRRKGRE